MRIRARLVAVALIPDWIWLVVIAVTPRNSDAAKTATLMVEYVQSVATGLEAFFSDARHAASIMAILPELSPEWNNGGYNLVLRLSLKPKGVAK